MPHDHDSTPEMQSMLERLAGEQPAVWPAGFGGDGGVRRRALEDAAKVCLAELVVSPDNADDETYNRAIRHCVEAIRGLMG